MSPMARSSEDVSDNVIDKPKVHIQEKVQKPTFYVVVVHNDPITPRQFVVEVLKRFFNKNESESTKIMLLAHNYGVGVVVKLPHDLAESKAKQVNESVRDTGYPLYFSVEKE
jgi:ATP-dependent Clp protease adaptor protein ClpS